MLDRDRARRLPFLVAAILAALAFVAFSPGLFGPFLWDDVPLIPSNPAVRTLSGFRAWFTRDFWDVAPELLQFGNRVRYYRPLVTASYALDWRIGGGDPFVFHLTNSIANAAVVVLAFLTLRRWTTSLVAAAVAAALYALHPTRAESIAWIAGRTDVFCALAMFVAVLGAGRRMRGERFGLPIELGATLIAYLTKEGAIVLPALMAVERWAALERPPLDRSVVRKIVLGALPQLAIAIAYVALRSVVMPLRPQTPVVALSEHAQFFFESIGRYVALALGVHQLSSQHALLRTFEGRYVHSPAFVAFGVAALVAAAVGVFVAWRRAPGIALGIGLFFALLLPVSNLMLMGLGPLVSERFLYLPLLGVALIVATAVERLERHRRFVLAAAAALACVSFARSLDRAIDFSDDGRFWNRELALHPESIDAHRYVIGRARRERRYLSAMRFARAAVDQAAKYYRHSGAELEFIEEYVEIAAMLTPDRSVDSLRKVDAFFASLLDPNAVEAEVSARGVHIVVRLIGPLRDRARAMRVRTLTARATVQSRLGAEDVAMGMVEDALRSCPACVHAATVGAVSAARVGDYPRARAFCDRAAAARGEEFVAEQRKAIESAFVAGRQAAFATGPIALNLRATELAKLEAWGRAYEVLAPYRVQIEGAPGFALGFAELAFRAGETAVAREVLAKQVPADKVGPTLDHWAHKMGWLE